MRLKGKTVALLIAPRGTEEAEFVRPRQALVEAGATVVVVGAQPGQASTVNGDLDPGSGQQVERTFSDVTVDQFDGVVIPGGTVGADRLRGNGAAVDFVAGFLRQGKPVAAICHGPWLLVEAGGIEGRQLTSFRTLQTDIRNAGGQWHDREVVVDGNLVTSRTPDDLPAFCTALTEALAGARG